MHRLITILASVIATLALTAGGAVAACPTHHQPPHAQRHVSNFAADCNGVVLHADSYDASKTNRWSVTIGGIEQHGTFGATFDQTFPVPQDGATTNWSGHIEAYDGTYAFDGAGTVGPCGTPPPPPPSCKNTPSLCPPPPHPGHPKAWIRVVNYCPPAGPHVEGRHNIKSWWRSHPSKDVYVIRAIAKKVTIDGHRVQALFSNGKATKTIRLHVKALCGHTGSS